MKLLFPQFLWALLALLIPLLIHLFNFRRHKTVYFSNTAFLRAVEKNTRSINRLKQLLIMAARMLALAALVFAFARPFIPRQGADYQQKETYLSLYIDNSYSMKVNGTNGPLLNQARNQAAELIKALPAQARVQVLSNSFNSRNQRFYNKEIALELIDQIEPSPAFRSWLEIKNRVDESWQEQETSDSARLALFVLSDLQQSAFEGISQADLPQTWDLNLVPLRPLNKVQNLAIDSVWFGSPVFQPGFDQRLMVKVENYGTEAIENTNLQLDINGKTVGMTNLSLPAEGSQTIELVYQPPSKGYFAGRLQLDGGAPAFDNEFYFSFSTRKKASVVAAGENLPVERLRALFSDSLFSFELQDFRNLNYTALPNQDLIILETSQSPGSGLLQALNKALQNGNNIFLVPGQKPAFFQEYLNGLNIRATADWKRDSLRGSRINFEDPYFYQVFTSRPENPELPRINGYYKFATNQLTSLLELENQAPLIAYQPTAAGDVFISAVPLGAENRDLVQHPVFTPIMLNAALFQGGSQHIYLRAGNAHASQFIESPGHGDQVLELRLEEQNIIPPQRYQQGGQQLFLPPQELEPGNYPVFKQDSLRGHLSVNVDARESQLTYLNQQNLLARNLVGQDAILEASAAKGLALQMQERYKGIQLWQWFVAAALFFLFLEVILIKFWR